MLYNICYIPYLFAYTEYPDYDIQKYYIAPPVLPDARKLNFLESRWLRNLYIALFFLLHYMVNVMTQNMESRKNMVSC